ncbi:MAG: hypothetical protein K6347_07185 [Campylobacterales bacterium]
MSDKELLRQLADISQPVPLEVHFPWELVVGVLIGLLFFVLLLVRRRRVTKTHREELIHRLETIDLSHPKEAAYQLTKIGFCLKSVASEEAYHEMVRYLEPYKYTPHPPAAFSDEALRAIHRFLKGVV